MVVVVVVVHSCTIFDQNFSKLSIKTLERLKMSYSFCLSQILT